MTDNLNHRHSSLTEDQAAAVMHMVEAEFGPGYWTGFVDYLTSDLPWHEWRFGGLLGFGGKVHWNGRRLYVSCYPGDDDGYEVRVLRLNEKLEEIARG